MENPESNSSLQVEKLRNRKSRAVWQNNNTNVHNNPYANLSTGERSRSRRNTGSSYVSPYGIGTGDENVYTGNSNNNNNKPSTGGNLLQVPGAHGDLNSNKKQNRRLSIHVSARQHGRSISQVGPIDMANLPALPKLGSEAMAKSKSTDLTIEQKIFKELSQGSAAEVDDYYKTLLKQKNLITRDIKDNINQNQKNILQLTKDLKETQEELIELRGTTKELYEVLGYFKESAQRRLELEFEPETQKELHSPQKSNQLGIPNNKKKDRSSIMVLKKMWDSQLQSLFKHVDGASKFVQPLPNRHIVAESGRWFEVNVGNWKSSYPTHLFIFNDLILVAIKKSSSTTTTTTTTAQETTATSGGSKSRLQAVQCWPLTQVSLQQIKSPKDNDDKMYFINLKSKSLSYVYSTDRYDHFVKVTEAFNKGRNEMIQSERLLDSRLSSPSNNNGESKEEKRQLRESLRNSGTYKEGVIDDSSGGGSGRKSAGTPNRNSNTDYVLHDISARVHSRNRSQDIGNNFNKLANNGKSQFFNEIKTLEDRLDDVDVEISHNQYAEAVELISIIESKLRNIENALTTTQRNKNVNIADELLLLDVSKLKIKNRKENVSNGLIFDLQHNIAKLKQDDIDNILTLFDSLEQLDRGVQGYLDSMSAYLSTTVSKLIVGLQGSTKIDVVNYLSNLMVINVSIVKRTIQTYEQIIAPILKRRHGDVDSSGLINWCIDEFTKLCKQIKKHLYGTLLISSGINMETDEPIYKVKEKTLYNNFLKIMQPQLEELKSVGLNVDYIFESILNIE
ncbi:U1 SNP1-associating protein, putative [Candida dubliniensis CD36]|uniref:Exocyst complex component EXO84 n=1 Tax=Candida dubliniensis (strain CD36 / ATCC MYA-646 / CBS 7987 / NCPF 3949 / NRRL Y-17841) TaxID=573826 RepID=B9WIK2_CANDC|nr:U1 SNP1-associating protein, putative [Candida dubliniensis CD36]CAX41067.1 U1 SNP1-associating protein, putative [Candida dubliniensis CD36]